MIEPTDGPTRFIPLADYKEPAMPAEEYFRRVLGRVQALITRGSPKPFMADDKLKRATLDILDKVVAPPACGPLLRELDATIRDWSDDLPRHGELPTPNAPSRFGLKVFVVPPCDETGILSTWAETAGHQILAAPARAALIEISPDPLPDLASTSPNSNDILVVPRLEDWFLRHRNGLRTVRALLAALDVCGRPVVIGCNSWAWAFLAKSVSADQILPEAVTFAAFDEMRLHGWFSQLATADATSAVQFRRSETGAEILELGNDGTPKDKFLRGLAGRSLGIPWVAWHMWRRSLRTDDRAKTDDGDTDDTTDAEQKSQQTLWVAALDELVLPGVHEQAALLVLQALLIHGALTAVELRLVLPIVGESNIVTVLAKAGFLTRDGDSFSCRPAAYPVIRAGLETAGLPLDRI